MKSLVKEVQKVFKEDEPEVAEKKSSKKQLENA